MADLETNQGVDAGSSVETSSTSGNTDNNRRVGFVSLGCPKALVDSERILTELQLEGYEISPSYDGADVVVVNTGIGGQV